MPMWLKNNGFHGNENISYGAMNYQFSAGGFFNSGQISQLKTHRKPMVYGENMPALSF
jgi:hypothetical protein